MKTTIESGGYEIIESKVLFLDDPQSEMTLRLENGEELIGYIKVRFWNRENENHTIEGKVENGVLVLNCINFNEPLGTGTDQMLGENSSGKSTLFQALHLVSYAYEKMMQEDHFANLAPVANEIGNFEDLCYKSAKEPIIKIGFQILYKEKKQEYWVHLGCDANDLFGRVIKVLGKRDNHEWDLLHIGISLKDLCS